jgi:hypothetical protein
VRPDNRPTADVSLHRRSARSRPGIAAHASATLTAADCTTVDGIPSTTLARTLLDLAEVVDRRGVERAIEQAEALRLFDLRAVEGALAGANGRRGAAAAARRAPTSPSQRSPRAISRSASSRSAGQPSCPAPK